MKDVFIPIEPEVKDKPAEELLMGGVTLMTTIDFPDCLSAVVLSKGVRGSASIVKTRISKAER